jgi:hypothetical protein
MFGDHPPAFGAQHPWLDPLAPQDLFDPRPDAELAMAGGLAPDPGAFPFTPEGRAAYYDALRSTARHLEMTQAMHMQQAADATRAQEEARDRRRASFLLFSR